MNEKLKTCPFCGGEAELRSFTSKENNQEIWYVTCQICEVFIENFKTKQQAIEAWNLRTTREYSQNEKLKECPFCGSNAKVFHSVIHTIFHVKCVNEITCGAELGYFSSEQEAIDSWNERSNHAQKIRHCPLCGSEAKVNHVELSDLYYVSCSNCFYKSYKCPTRSQAILEWYKGAERILHE